jgi:hypothetical protein
MSATTFFSTAGQPGDLRIGITSENEIRYWTKALNCSEKELHEAIAIVGPMVLAVRKYLVFNS